MYIVTVDHDLCEACGDCIDSCPVAILGQDAEGKACVTGDEAECMGCEACVTVCDSGAMSVTEY